MSKRGSKLGVKRGPYSLQADERLQLALMLYWTIKANADPTKSLKSMENYCHKHGIRLLPPALIDRLVTGDLTALMEPEPYVSQINYYLELASKEKDPVKKAEYQAKAKQALDADNAAASSVDLI